MSKIIQADNKIMQKQTSLTKEQKEVVGLLVNRDISRVF